MQAPFFKERGLDLSGFHRGTLNISVAPRRFRIRNARLHFSSVQWTSKHPLRAFLLFCVLVDFQESEVRRLIHYPHPEKARHHQNDSVIEVLAPWIEGIQYGDHFDLEVRESEVEIM